MSSGGARPGAGRKRGALTTKTLGIVEEELAKGHAPLERMLNYANFLASEAEKMRPSLIDAFSELRVQGFDADLVKMIREILALSDKAFAADASVAPYCHPRLGALAVHEPIRLGMTNTDGHLNTNMQKLSTSKKLTPEE